MGLCRVVQTCTCGLYLSFKITLSVPSFRTLTYYHLSDPRLNQTGIMVHECSDLADFKAQLSAAGSKLVVVDFHATWCGPCKMIAPIIVEMAGKMDNVVFLKVDVDEAEDVAGEYNISAMPTFVFLKDGKKIDDLMGANADKLKELVNKHSS